MEFSGNNLPLTVELVGDAKEASVADSTCFIDASGSMRDHLAALRQVAQELFDNGMVVVGFAETTHVLESDEKDGQIQWQGAIAARAWSDHTLRTGYGTNFIGLFDNLMKIKGPALVVSDGLGTDSFAPKMKAFLESSQHRVSTAFIHTSSDCDGEDVMRRTAVNGGSFENITSNVRAKLMDLLKVR
jgi:hypothetical protein